MKSIGPLCIAFLCCACTLALAQSPQAGLWGINDEMTGAPGRGFQVDVQGDVLVFTYYGYRDSGQPTFYLASGPLAEGNFQAPLEQFAFGTSLGGAYQPAESVGSPGVVRLQFSSSTQGTVILPGEEAKAISRVSFSDLSGDLNQTFEGTSFEIGPFSDDSSTFVFSVGNGQLKLTREAFLSGTCIYEGAYQLAGNTISATGAYRCSDFSDGSFRAENLKVDPTGLYTGTFFRHPSGSGAVYREVHAGK